MPLQNLQKDTLIKLIPTIGENIFCKLQHKMKHLKHKLEAWEEYEPDMILPCECKHETNKQCDRYVHETGMYCECGKLCCESSNYPSHIHSICENMCCDSSLSKVNIGCHYKTHYLCNECLIGRRLLNRPNKN